MDAERPTRRIARLSPPAEGEQIARPMVEAMSGTPPRFTRPTPDERKAAAALGTVQGHRIRLHELPDGSFFAYIDRGARGTVLVSMCWCCRRYWSGKMFSLGTFFYSGPPPLPPGLYCPPCWTLAENAPDTRQ